MNIKPDKVFFNIFFGFRILKKLKKMEYTEIHYCKENNIIKLFKNGAFYKVISKTDLAIMLINLQSNTSRLIFKNDFPKIYICKDNQ